MTSSLRYCSAIPSEQWTTFLPSLSSCVYNVKDEQQTIIHTTHRWLDLLFASGLPARGLRSLGFVVIDSRVQSTTCQDGIVRKICKLFWSICWFSTSSAQVVAKQIGRVFPLNISFEMNWKLFRLSPQLNNYRGIANGHIPKLSTIDVSGGLIATSWLGICSALMWLEFFSL